MVDYKVQDGAIAVTYDKDEDGIPSAEAKLHLSEAIAEALKRGEAVEGVGKFKFAMNGTRLVVELDTDQDGEKSFEIALDLAEAANEAGLI